MAPIGSGKRLSFEGLPPQLLRQGLAYPFVGIATMSATMAITLGLHRLVRDLQRGSVSTLTFGYLALWLVVAVLSLIMGQKFSAFALLAEASRERLQGVLGDYPYVLYLRSFTQDHRLFAVDRARGRGLGPILGYLVGLTGGHAETSDIWEVRVVQHFRRFGPVFGVADPRATHINPGIRRFLLPKEISEQGWRPELSDAIRRARLVLFVASISEAGDSAAGTLWEYTEAVRLLPPSRVLLLVCGEQKDYDRFREEAHTAFIERYGNAIKGGLTAPVLPDLPMLEHPRLEGRAHPLRGVIRFGPQWTSQVVRFDPTVQRGLTPSSRWRATVRHQIEPLLADVESQLPGEAVIPKADYRSRAIISLMFATGYPVVAYSIIHSSRFLSGEKVLLLALPIAHCLGMLYSLTINARTQRYFKVVVRRSPRETTPWTGPTEDPADDVNTLARLVKERARVLGPDDPETLATRGLLAISRGRAGDPAGAADALAELLFEMLRVVGREHPLTVGTLGSLAQCRGAAGDPVGATNSLTQLLPELVRVLGPDHPDTLASRSSIAMFRSAAGDWAGAADTYADLLTDMLRVLGPDHPQTIHVRNSLVVAQGKAGGQGQLRE
ncbi:tetratricopeptide repeat protein [Streptomyces sp. or20]|uniref:tetratricopeptide repeat protein n=1 Tax=Streptomyces sp. or20 TaxID=1828016 RepID=UPI00117F1132|nr:tetratricopeptide repeat protein [Streptomyces sp. or20]